MASTDALDRVGRIETLLGEVDALPDPAARETATEVVQALLDLYGEGLARFVEHVAARDDGDLAEALAADELVSHLLLLHGLHPVPLETRVRGALDEVRPYLATHGGNVELMSVDDGVARLRMEGSCSGCPSSAITLKLAIEDAIHKAAPDVAGIEAVDGAPAAPAPSAGLIELQMVGSPTPLPMAPAAEPPQAAAAWAMAGGMPELQGAGPLVKQVAGEPVLFLRVDGDVLAYRPDCPGCGVSLGDAALGGVELACAGCGHRYDVRRAGRAVDVPELALEPVPLLVDEAGLVKVALGVVA